METPAVAGASLRFTTVIDFPKEVPVNHVSKLHIIIDFTKLNHVLSNDYMILTCKFNGLKPLSENSYNYKLLGQEPLANDCEIL